MVLSFLLFVRIFLYPILQNRKFLQSGPQISLNENFLCVDFKKISQRINLIKFWKKFYLVNLTFLTIPKLFLNLQNYSRSSWTTRSKNFAKQNITDYPTLHKYLLFKNKYKTPPQPGPHFPGSQGFAKNWLMAATGGPDCWCPLAPLQPSADDFISRQNEPIGTHYITWKAHCHISNIHMSYCVSSPLCNVLYAVTFYVSCHFYEM